MKETDKNNAAPALSLARPVKERPASDRQEGRQNRHDRCRPTEQGEATTELVLVTPVLLLLIGFVVQFAVWYHASHVARAAAQEGVRAARAFGGSAEAGQARAEHFLAETGPTIVRGAEVTAFRDAQAARVEVRGHAPSVVPGLRLGISAEAQSPTERFSASPPAGSP